MAFVLDASVPISWFFPDEHHTHEEAAWRRIARESAIVPIHWWFEIRNSMLVAERRGRMSQASVSRALDRLSTLRITTAPRPKDKGVFAIARGHRLTFYDAVYLELAHRESVALATLDGELIKAARVEGVPIVAAVG